MASTATATTADTAAAAAATASPAARRRVVRNWACTYHATPADFHEPDSVPAVQALVRAAGAAGRTVRVIGSGHSPNDCALSDDVMLSLARLSRVLVVDAEARRVKVQAGATVAALNEVLALHGLAFDTLGSISDQSIAGLICTATHGTGLGKPAVHACVEELQLVLASGELVVASRAHNADLFAAAKVSLGVLGVIVGVVFRAVPAFDIASVQTAATLDAVLADVPARAASAEYYRFWWFPHTDKALEWRGSKVPPGVHRRAVGPWHSVVGVSNAVADARAWAVNTAFGFHALQFAYWLGLAVPALLPVISWLWQRVQFSAPVTRVERSDRQFNFNCLFKQHVDEWAIPLRELPAAMRALRRLTTDSDEARPGLTTDSDEARPASPPAHFQGPSGRVGGGDGSGGGDAWQRHRGGGVAARRPPYRVHFPVEVRFVAGDDAWLSPSPGPGPVAYVGVIMYKPFGCHVEYADYFRDFEAVMAAHGGRPHWAKDFHLAGDAGLGPRYARWAQFKALRGALDPGGVFLNPWARRVLGVEPPQGGSGGGGGGGGASTKLVVETGLPLLPRSPASFLSPAHDGESCGSPVGGAAAAAVSS